MVDANKEEVKEATLIEVPTQMGMAIQLEDGSQVNELGLLLKIYNDLQKVKRSLI